MKKTFTIASINNFLIITLFTWQNKGLGFVVNELFRAIKDPTSPIGRLTDNVTMMHQLLSGKFISADDRLSLICENVASKLDVSFCDNIMSVLCHGSKTAFTAAQVNDFIAVSMHLARQSDDVSAASMDICLDAFVACEKGSFNKELGLATTRLHLLVDDGIPEEADAMSSFMANLADRSTEEMVAVRNSLLALQA